MSNKSEDETIESLLDALDPAGEAGPKIKASDEMAEALREATAAVDEEGEVVLDEGTDPSEGGAADSSSLGDGGLGGETGASTDKMTIEVLAAELQDLKGLHEQKLKENDEQNEHHLRLQAEFENFRRRSLKEKQESFKFGHQNLVKDLLSTVDNLERALEHGAQNAGPEVQGILDGVSLVYREILGALGKHGVSEIQAEGQVFDPAVHEAMGQIPNGAVPNNTVLQVLQKGYVIHDRMLRPSRVIVSREPTPEELEQAGAGSGDKTD